MAENKEEKKEEKVLENQIVSKAGRVEDVALEKITQYINLGLQLPKDFNPTNSLKQARIMLNDMTTSVMCDDGKYHDKPVLEVCDRNSIIQCLIESCCQGLDYSQKQIYMIARWDKIKRCFKMTNMESIYGRIVRAKRASKNYKDNVTYVHKGDDFQLGVFTYTDVLNNRCKQEDIGKYYIIKHDINMENLDGEITHAYTYVTDNDGDTKLCVMTKQEWLKSWSKSSMKDGNQVAKDFEKDMIYRTIIKKATKYLVNSDVNSGNDSDDDTPLAGSNAPNTNLEQESQEFEEAQIVEDAKQLEKGDKENPQVMEQPQNVEQKQATTTEEKIKNLEKETF